MRITSIFSKVIILSYIEPVKMLFSVRSSKSYQKQLNISIDYYKTMSYIRSDLQPKKNMADYFKYYQLKFPSIDKETIRSILLHYLNELSKTQNIEIDNLTPFSYDILKHVNQNIILNIKTYKNYPSDYKSWNNSNIKGIVIDILDEKDDFDEMINYTKEMMPLTTKELTVYRIYDKRDIISFIEEFEEYTELERFESKNSIVLDLTLLARYKNLKNLYIFLSDMHSNDYDLTPFKNVTEFNLSYLQFPMSNFSISNPSLDEFIKPFRSQITKLDLSFPMLPVKITDEFFPNVEELRFSSILSPQLKCPKLKILRISNPIESIEKTCHDSPLLEKIKLVYTLNTVLGKNVKLLLDSLQKLKHLKKLIIIGNEFTSCEGIFESTIKSNVLTKFKIKNIHTFDVITFLKNNPNLEKISLEGATIQSINKIDLLNLSLERITTFRCKVDEDFTVFRLIKKCSKLKKLSLEFESVEHIELFLDYVEKLKNLESLSIISTSQGTIDLKLIKNIRKCIKLTYVKLDLPGNFPKYVEKLIEVVDRLPFVRDIGIGQTIDNCNFQKHLVKKIKEKEYLKITYLDIDKNQEVESALVYSIENEEYALTKIY